MAYQQDRERSSFLAADQGTCAFLYMPTFLMQGMSGNQGTRRAVDERLVTSLLLGCGRFFALAATWWTSPGFIEPCRARLIPTTNLKLNHGSRRAVDEQFFPGTIAALRPWLPIN